jgi:hypothetical protein
MKPSQQMQATRLRQALRYPGQGRFHAYVGTPPVEIFNIDGNTPYIRQLSVNEAMTLTALSGVVEDVAFWLLRVVSDTRHPVTENWQLQIDGVTFGVQCIKRAVKTSGSESTAMCYEYYLKGNP